MSPSACWTPSNSTSAPLLSLVSLSAVVPALHMETAVHLPPSPSLRTTSTSPSLSPPSFLPRLPFFTVPPSPPACPTANPTSARMTAKCSFAPPRSGRRWRVCLPHLLSPFQLLPLLPSLSNGPFISSTPPLSSPTTSPFSPPSTIAGPPSFLISPPIDVKRPTP